MIKKKTLFIYGLMLVFVSLAFVTSIPRIFFPGGSGSVSWNSITGKPVGFADNVDNDSADSPVWSSITGMPSGFSDNVDNNTLYTHVSNFTNDLNFITNSTMNKSVSCASIIGGSDGDFCSDASAGTESDPLWTANYTAYNSSWSSTTNTSYYLNTNPFGFYNVTTAPIYLNDTFRGQNYSDYLITKNYAINSTGNASTGNCPTGQVVMNTTTSGVQCITPTTVEIDPLWTGNQSSYVNYNNISNLNVNSSIWWKSYNSTNSTQFENIAGGLTIIYSWLTSYINSWFSGKITDDLTQGSINLYDNKSWNQTHANTLYYGILNPNSYYNSTNPQPISDVWVNSSGDTMNGNLILNASNLYLNTSQYVCWGNSTNNCLSNITNNGTHSIWW